MGSGPSSQLLHAELGRPRSEGGSGLAPSHRGASRIGGDTEGRGERWIQRDTGWLPSSRTHRLLSGSGAEHAAVWRDGAAVDPLHVARQHLDLPPWGRQTRKSREGSTSGSAGQLSPPFPKRECIWGWGVPLGRSQACNPLLHLRGPTWKGMALLRVAGLSPSACLIPKHPFPPSSLPRWVSPLFSLQQSPASAGDDLAPEMSPRAPTISAQVPDAQGLVPRGRHKDEASIGSKAQVSDDVLVPQEAEEEVSCGGGPCSAPSRHGERGGAPQAQAAPLGTGQGLPLIPGKYLGKDGDGIPFQGRARGEKSARSHGCSRRRRGPLTCLHLPDLDLPVVEPGGQDQAGKTHGAGRVRLPGLCRRPGAEGQAPHNLAALQRLLLGHPSAPWLRFAAAALALRGFAAAKGERRDAGLPPVQPGPPGSPPPRLRAPLLHPATPPPLLTARPPPGARGSA